MAVVLITDSGCDLTVAMAEKLEIRLVPMTVHFGAEEYYSGITLTNEEFYNKLAAATELPTTSQPTPYDFEKQYQKVKASGDEAVVLCVSSELSGTYQSACIAMDGYEDCIHVVDSRAVSIAQKVLLDYAITLRDSGSTAKEIAAALEVKKQDVCAYGAVDTLEYLIKGGRLSKAAGAVGSMLGIRPVLYLNDGALGIAGKARGVKGAITMTHKLVSQVGIDFNMPVGVGYTGNDASVLDPYLNCEESVWIGNQVPVYNVGSTVGTHSGPGFFICAFFKKS